MRFTEWGPPHRNPWKQHKQSWSENETPRAHWWSSNDSQSRDTPAERVCAHMRYRPGRQSAGTCRFNPNQHKISWLWQHNLSAFPCSPTNGLLTLQPWNGQIKGCKTFQKNFFCHFQWRLLHNSSTEVSNPSVKQETNGLLRRPTELTLKILVDGRV